MGGSARLTFALAGVLLVLTGCPQGAPDDTGTGDACVADGECDTDCAQPDPDCDTQPPDGDGETDTFSDGGLTVAARTVQSGDTSTTTVTEAGETLVEMVATVDGVSLSFPTEGVEGNTISFSTPLDAVPSEFATNHLATFIAGQLFGDGGGGLRPDNPGCDMFPDTRCTLGCCADHDRCFADNDCNFLSWLTTVFIPGSSLFNACSNCNSVAAACIVRACGGVGVVGTGSDDKCFDNRCGEFYTCPPPDELDCFACPLPCSETPATCGNGSCDVLETPENCASDCATGSGVNTCCIENSGCPSETPSTCPGDCCCCGFGEVCGAGNLCVSG